MRKAAVNTALNLLPVPLHILIPSGTVIQMIQRTIAEKTIDMPVTFMAGITLAVPVLKIS